MERARGYTIKINTCSEVVLKCMPGIGDAIANRIMDIRNKEIHIDGEVLEQIPYLRVTEGLLGLIDFESSPTRENAGAEHPSIAFGDQDRQSTPILARYVWRHMIIETRLCANLILDNALQSVLESEIEKVSGEIESLLGELGHLSDVSDRESLTPSPRTNMVVQRQQEQQDFAGSLQRKQVLDLTSQSQDIRQHLTMDSQQKPTVANLHQLDQQVINRPQTVNNSHRQDITSVSSDDTPNDHVLHFSPRVQHGMPYRQQDQQEASRLQQASPAHYRLVNSNSPVIQQRDIYKPETPSVERVQPFQPPIQQDNYHRQLQFNEYDTVIPSTNKYQVGTNNIQSGVNRVQPPTLQSQTYVPSPQQVPKPQIGSTNQQQGVNRVQQPMLPVKKGVQLQQQVQSLHQRLAQLQLGVNSYAQPTQQQNPATAPVSLPQQQLHQQQPAYQQPWYQPPNFVPRTQPPTTIGHPTSMFQPPRVGPPPQGPTQSFNQQNMSSITYPVMGQPTFSRPPDISNYQPQSHTLPVQQQQPPSSGAPPAHNNQPSARRKEYDSDYHERQRRRDPGRYYTADSDTSDASPYRQTRNKRRSAPAYLSDHSHRAFSPMRSARTSPAYSRHSSRRSLTARESQSESETDSGHSRKACISKPKSMDAALDMIRWCQHTRKAVSAIQKPGKPVHESSSEKPGNSPVVLGVGSSKSSMDTRLSRIEEHIERIVTSLAQEKSVRQEPVQVLGHKTKTTDLTIICHIDATMAEGVAGEIIQVTDARTKEELRQNNNRQQSKQLTPKKNTKEERRVEFDDDNFTQDDSEESSTKGVSVGTLGTAHLLRCIVKIQDKEVNALIDTGSEVTIVKDSIFETLVEKPYIIRESTMHGAGRDMLMTCRITNPVEFSIQQLTFNERLYVAPIDCDMLIGADFLIKHSAILDVPAKKLTLKNTVVELILGGEPKLVPIVNRVTVHETIIIPPNTAMRIDLNTEDVASDYLIEPKGNSTLLIPRTVYHPVKLPKGDEVGYTQEVSVIQSLEYEPLPSVGTCTANSKTKNSSKPGIPSHLKDLYVDSGSNLSKSQQTLLRQLLIKYSDVFAKEDFDLGSFDTIEHTIKTE
ncbi:unnamed protein product [Mytilus edulis]|uniref:Peptidase A2 domain-containing protein n=1 Tax=Mytilus edulis TaxID=6550 RepID=A0A8S3QDE7_MYTED|nr:unnamed protein product [Mytilus edulis]